MNNTPKIKLKSNIFIYTALLSQLPQDKKTLCSFELDELNKMSSHKRRKEYLSARTLLKKLIIKHKLPQFKPNKIMIKRDQHGQPIFTNPLLKSKFFFSLSHTQEKICIALSELGPIGLDLESINRFKDLKSNHRKKWLHKNEEKSIFKSQNPNYYIAKTWTLKEALYKCSSNQRLVNFRDLDLSSFMFQKSFSQTFHNETYEFISYKKNHSLISLCISSSSSKKKIKSNTKLICLT